MCAMNKCKGTQGVHNILKQNLNWSTGHIDGGYTVLQLNIYFNLNHLRFYFKESDPSLTTVDYLKAQFK